MHKKKLSLQWEITLLVCGVVLLALIVTNVLVSSYVADRITYNTSQNAMNIARIVAQSPYVTEGLAGKIEEAEIQRYANEIQRATNVTFIVVFDKNGIRKSHPDEAKVGLHIVGGDETDALKGESYISYAEGTLGTELRAFVPVYHEGAQVGALVVGILLDDVSKAVIESHNRIVFATLLGTVIGIVGAVMLARSIKKTLFGLEPAGIAKMLEERNAMLQSVREGVLAVDSQGIITLVNDEALRLFTLGGATGQPVNQPVDEYLPNTGLIRVMNTGVAEYNQEQILSGVSIITNRVPIRVAGNIVGAIATFRDKTEVNQLAEELTGVRNYVEALRSQAHEFMNKLHVILGMVRLECYDQLADYIMQTADVQTTEVSYVSHRIKDTIIAGLILSKLSRSREMGALLFLSDDSYLPASDDETIFHDIVTILGNLLDNAIDAVQTSDTKNIFLRLKYDAGMLEMRVTDSGPGFSAVIQENIFKRGVSTKAGGHGIGLYLVRTTVDRLQGNISISSTSAGAEILVTIPYNALEDIS